MIEVGNTVVSHFQADVSALLHALGVPHSMEYKTEARARAPPAARAASKGGRRHCDCLFLTPAVGAPQNCIPRATLAACTPATWQTQWRGLLRSLPSTARGDADPQAPTRVLESRRHASGHAPAPWSALTLP